MRTLMIVILIVTAAMSAVPTFRRRDRVRSHSICASGAVANAAPAFETPGGDAPAASVAMGHRAGIRRGLDNRAVPVRLLPTSFRHGPIFPPYQLNGGGRDIVGRVHRARMRKLHGTPGVLAAGPKMDLPAEPRHLGPAIGLEAT